MDFSTFQHLYYIYYLYFFCWYFHKVLSSFFQLDSWFNIPVLFYAFILPQGCWLFLNCIQLFLLTHIYKCTRILIHSNCFIVSAYLYLVYVGCCDCCKCSFSCSWRLCCCFTTIFILWAPSDDLKTHISTFTFISHICFTMNPYKHCLPHIHPLLHQQLNKFVIYFKMTGSTVT